MTRDAQPSYRDEQQHCTVCLDDRPVPYENIDLIEEYGQTDIEEAMALYNESAASFF
jgi:hypothetical protein